MYVQLPTSKAPTANKGTSIWKWIVRGVLATMAFAAVVVVAGLFYVRSQALIDAVYPDVTSEQLADIEKYTGIVFPKGAVGLGYYYDHWTCIDPSMAAKVRIPSHLLDEFRSNKLLFPKSDRANVVADFRSWWKPDNLNKISEGEFNKDEATVQWTLGTERDEPVIYIHWAVY